MYAILCSTNTHTVSQFAQRVGVSVNTLQRWDREGRLTAFRTVAHRRMYTDDHLTHVFHLHRGEQQRCIVAYLRVSSTAQTPDLANQRAALEVFCTATGLVVDEWIAEIGGGLNLKRPKFLALVDAIISGSVATLVIAHKDRLACFGIELIQHLCSVHGTTLLILNTETLSPEQEMVHDLLAIVHCFSARLYGLRNYRNALRKALNDGTLAQDTSQSNA